MHYIDILPCLQEIKQLRYFEPEQQEGVFNKHEQSMHPKFRVDSSDQYYKYWNRDNNYQKIQDTIFDNIYRIPPFKDYGFSGQCIKYKMVEKWKMYLNYFHYKFSNNQGKKIYVIMVTDHNRLRSRNSYQGLFPMDDKCDAYANTFCLKIYNDDEGIDKLNCKIIHKGEADKGKFRDICSVDNSINTTTMSNRSLGSKRTLKSKRRFTPNLSKIAEEDEVQKEDEVREHQEGGTEKKYNYCCGTYSENDNLIFSNSLDIIQTAFNDSNFKKYEFIINIFLIRHGNAIHNKPIKTNRREARGNERLDSSLSEEGILQAENLGNILKLSENINTSDLLVCTSFLTRTKHTALILMDKLYDSNLHENLKEKKENLNEISIIRENPLLDKGDKPKQVDKSKQVNRSLLQSSESIRPSTRSPSVIPMYTMSGSGLKKHNRTKRPKRMRKKKSGGYKSRKPRKPRKT